MSICNYARHIMGPGHIVIRFKGSLIGMLERHFKCIFALKRNPYFGKISYQGFICNSI